MRTSIRGRNVSVADQDREYVGRKLARLERILGDGAEATVELREEGRRNAAGGYVVEVGLLIDGDLVRGVGRGMSYRAAVDAVVDRLERQAVERRQRPRERARSAEGSSQTAPLPTPRLGDDEGAALVVKVKRFAIEPMFEEDAVARMEELGHTFFIFVNAENERLGVLYRRRDGRYGLIEPVVGGEYTTGRA